VKTAKLNLKMLLLFLTAIWVAGGKARQAYSTKWYRGGQCSAFLFYFCCM